MVGSIKQFKTGSVHGVLQSKRQARQDKSTNTVDLIICDDLEDPLLVL